MSKYEQENLILKAIIENSNTAIATIDLDGNFIETNSLYTKILGYSQKEFKQLSCSKIAHNEFEFIIIGMLYEAKEKGNISSVRTVLISKNNKEVYVEFSLNLLPNNNTFVAVINPLKDKIEAEKTLNINNKLEDLNKKLADEVREKDKQLNYQDKMLLQQSKINDMKELIEAVVNQWKDSLSVIKLSSSQLQFMQEEDILTTNYTNKMTSQIENKINDLVEITDEFKSFFNSQVDTEKISIKTVIDSALLLLKEEITKINIKIEFIGDILIEANLVPSEFKYVITNFIHNAKNRFEEKDIKDPHIKFELNKENNFIMLQIADNAHGILSNSVDDIYDINCDSVGVGLYMIKNIMKKVGITINVINTEAGTTYKVMIPCK